MCMNAYNVYQPANSTQLAYSVGSMGYIGSNMVQCAGNVLEALACFWLALKYIEGKKRNFSVYRVQKRTSCTLNVEN